MKRLFLAAAVALLTIAGAEIASAGTITSAGFAGTNAGKIGSTSFSNAAFAITEVAHASSITNCGNCALSVGDLSSTIAIAGLSLSSVTSGARVFDQQPTAILGYSRSGRSGIDLVDLGNSASGSYYLAMSVGPICRDCVCSQPFNCRGWSPRMKATSIPQGNMDVTFTAITVPESATFALLGLGCLAIGFFRHLRRKKTCHISNFH